MPVVIYIATLFCRPPSFWQGRQPLPRSLDKVWESVQSQETTKLEGEGKNSSEGEFENNANVRNDI